MANVLLGVTGGIAAYKAVYLSRLFHKNGHKVKVLMTHAASEFVKPLTFEGIGNEVFMDDFTGRSPLSHIELARWADIAVIAPATANTVAKLAYGLADNLLSSCMLAFTGKKVVCPAMNNNMYLNPATQDNINILKKRGFHIITPATGELACGDFAVGKLEEPEVIARITDGLLSTDKTAAGLKILVTAGPTVESIDPVRYISNRSSGKMGYAVARQAELAGGDVTLISGPTILAAPVDNTVRVESAAQMYEQVIKYVNSSDIVVMSAAVADYTFNPAPQKIKKTGADLVLNLMKTVDILKTTSKAKRDNQVFVGFAAESEDVKNNAVKKLREKSLDMIVANDISRKDIGFSSDENEVAIYYAHRESEIISKRAKDEIARIVIERAVEIYKSKA